jgi:hypothetical protein
MHRCRMLKKAVQQGRRRSKIRRRYRPHFVGPFARSMDLGERKNTSSTSALREYHRYVEDSCELRTPLAGFFSSLSANRVTDLLDRQPDDKTAAGRDVRFDPHPPTHTFDDVPDDRQSEPCST